jgi:arylsulfatase A-like enzyme
VTTHNNRTGGAGTLHLFSKVIFLSAILSTFGVLLSGCELQESNDHFGKSAQNDITAVVDSQKPNVLIIVVDDAGFADLGFMGGEIPTPNLDALANDGVILTNFHTAPTCSPTRSMLLSGVDSHIAGLGNMFEELAPNQKNKPGYEGYLHERIAPLPALFQDAGYETFMSGKWHLGLADEQAPTQRGFDKAFALLQGGAGHFSDMQSLWETEVGQRGKAKYRENGKILSKLPDNFKYSSQFYVDKMLDYIEQRDNGNRKRSSPFFGYLSFTAPHWPLQAPPEAIARHHGQYDLGYEVLAQRRLARQIELGILPPKTPLSSRPSDAAAWQDLSPEEKALSVRRMEIYAAMVDETDRHIGRLIDALEVKGLLDNTVVVFMSDNGAEGHSLDALFPEAVFPKAREWVLGTFDYELEALGSADSYVLYGSGWGWAATPAFRGYKAYVSQGGTRAPAFVSFPKRLASGVKRSELLSVQDITPTLLELAAIPAPEGIFAGRPVSTITGRSMLPLLQQNSEATNNNAEPRVLGFELFGKRSIRQGSWNLLEMYSPQGTGKWQLYDVNTDLAEEIDLANSRPDKLKELIELWDVYADENNVVLPDWNSGY